jgi:hypothetical protein
VEELLPRRSSKLLVSGKPWLGLQCCASAYYLPGYETFHCPGNSSNAASRDWSSGKFSFEYSTGAARALGQKVHTKPIGTFHGMPPALVVAGLLMGEQQFRET